MITTTSVQSFIKQAGTARAVRNLSLLAAAPFVGAGLGMLGEKYDVHPMRDLAESYESTGGNALATIPGGLAGGLMARNKSVPARLAAVLGGAALTGYLPKMMRSVSAPPSTEMFWDEGVGNGDVGSYIGPRDVSTGRILEV